MCTAQTGRTHELHSTQLAETSKSSCTAGAVHTWALFVRRAPMTNHPNLRRASPAWPRLLESTATLTFVGRVETDAQLRTIAAKELPFSAYQRGYSILRRRARTALGVSPKRARNNRFNCEISGSPACNAMSIIRLARLSGASVSSAKARCSRSSMTRAVNVVPQVSSRRCRYQRG